MWGADLEHLERLSRELQKAAERLEHEICSPLSQAIAQSSWQGADAEAFRYYWQTQGRSLLAQASQALSTAARVAQQNADEQQAASSHDGALAAMSMQALSSPQLSSVAGATSLQGGIGIALIGMMVSPIPYSGISNTQKKIPDGTRLSGGFTTGQQPRPKIVHDDDFPYGSKKDEATWKDSASWYKWGTILAGSQTFRPDLDDANSLYAHYRSNTGTDQWVDYEEAYREDSGIRQNLDNELSQAKQAAKNMTANGYTDFTFQSDVRSTHHYPSTSNWQKALGGHSYWSTSEVHVDNGVATMKVVIEAEDMWNFNKGAADIETGAADSENGRFQELGWAKQFKTHGKIERTYTWSVEDSAQIDAQGNAEPSGPSLSEDGILSGRSSGGIREDRNEPVGGGARPNLGIREPIRETPFSRGQGKRE